MFKLISIHRILGVTLFRQFVVVVSRRRSPVVSAGLCYVIAACGSAVPTEPTTPVDSLPIVATGDGHACKLDKSGKAWCWGRNPDGQLGDGTTQGYGPVQVVGDHLFTSLVVGGRSTCGLTELGKIWCWGLNVHGQLGTGSNIGPEICTLGTSQLSCSLTPVMVEASVEFQSVAAGDLHICALDTKGRPWCWGSHQDGQFGFGPTLPPTCTIQICTAPTPAETNIAFDHLFTGAVHTCALTSDGATYCWGAGDFGALGKGTEQSHDVPTPSASGFVFQIIAGGIGGGHTCALGALGNAYCWGAGPFGGLGTTASLEVCGVTPCATQPIPVEGGHQFHQISAGPSFTCALDGASHAWCWGINQFGQLGNGQLRGPEQCFSQWCARTPVSVIGGLTFVSISSGASHACALTDVGEVYCWGNNSAMLLGPDVGHSATPVRIIFPPA